MVAQSTTYPVRLAPSGPEIGNPPQVIGVGDGSGQGGRCWRFQGAGTSTQVPGSAAGDVAGLGALAVNLLPGYSYDVEFIGYTSGTGGQYKATVLGSIDGGNTYPVVIEQGPTNANASEPGVYVCRLVNAAVAAGTVIDHVKVQWQRSIVAGADLTYLPTDCSLVIQEWSHT